MKKLLYSTLFILFLISCSTPEKQQLDLAHSYLYTQPDSTLFHLNQIDSSKLPTELYMQYLLLKIRARYSTNQDISADTLLFCYKNKFRKFPADQAAYFHFYTGKIYHSQGNTEKAIQEYMESEKLLKTDSYLTAMLQASYAEIHKHKLELKKAITLYQKASQAFEKIHHWANASICYNQMGNCYLYEDILDTAYIYYQKSLQHQNHWLPKEEAQILTDIAQAYYIMGKETTATQFLNRVLTLPVENELKATAYFHLANLHIETPDLFLYHIQHAIDLVNETTPALTNRLYLALAEYNANAGDYKQAYQHHRQYSQYLSQAIEVGYDTTVKELKQENHIRQLQTDNLRLIARNQRIYLALLSILLLCTLSSTFIVHRYKNKKQQLLEARHKINILKEMATEVDHKNNSLRNIVLQHFNLLKKVAQLEAIPTTKSQNKTLVSKFNNIVYSQDSINWEILYSTINSAHDNLCNKIKDTYSQLKETEFKVCCLTVAKFSNPEIGIILNKSPHTIPGIKSDIRKKLGIPSQGNITTFFIDQWKTQPDTVHSN